MRAFWCPVCASPSISLSPLGEREGSNCIRCGSNSRQRAVAHLGIFAWEQLQKENRPLQVCGISDGHNTEIWAKERFQDNYINFQYHREPKLDLVDVDPSLLGSFGLIFCSEVLEHVEPPVSRAFHGLSGLLRPGGYMVLSVPFLPGPFRHVEHFATLRDARIEQTPSGPEWTGIDPDGNSVTYRNLNFHGGEGATLEFRVFSEDSLERHLSEVGLCIVQKLQNRRWLGIVWEPWSRVWLVRKLIR